MYTCSQKRASDLIIDVYGPPCSCWELNLGPLEEQPVLFLSMCNVIMDFRQQVKKMESMVWFLAVAGDGVVGGILAEPCD